MLIIIIIIEILNMQGWAAQPLDACKPHECSREAMCVDGNFYAFRSPAKKWVSSSRQVREYLST